MPGIGWSEILIVAILAVLVVGPKDLPVLMRTIGRYVGKARAIAREFQESFEEIAREAELEEARKEAENLMRPVEMPDMKSLMTPASPPTRPAPVVPGTALSAAQEAALREQQNAKVLADEAAAKEAAAVEPEAPAPAPLEPGGAAEPEATPEASNVTPFRGGAHG